MAARATWLCNGCVQYNEIRLEGAREFVRALERNASMTHLNMGVPALESESDESEGFAEGHHHIDAKKQTCGLVVLQELKDVERLLQENQIIAVCESRVAL